MTSKPPSGSEPVTKNTAGKSAEETKAEVEDSLILVDPNNGNTIKKFTFPDGMDVYAHSSDGNWLSVIDKKGIIWRVNVATQTQEKMSNDKIDSPTRTAITKDGRYIFATTWTASLLRWDAVKKTMDVIVDGFRGQASCLRLSDDEKFAIIGGNHFDIGVYEIETKKTGFYTRVDASDFYVPQAWMKGDRLIYITDGGVMFDGIFSK